MWGGMINRSVVGAPDEGGMTLNGNVRSDRGGWGWYKNGGYPPEMFDCGSDNPGCDSKPGCDCKDYYLDAVNGYIDTQPDIYTFNVMGHSGKFFFDKNKNPHFIPKIDYIIKPLDAQLSSWILIAPDGMRFYFGGSGATENSHTGLHTSDLSKTSTTWFLTRIESVNKKHNIYFTYVNENYSYGTRSGHSVAYKTGQGCSLSGSNIAGSLPMINNINGVRLSKITTSSGFTEITFNPSSSNRIDLSRFNTLESVNDQAKALQSIEIKNGVFCKKFLLRNSYFESAVSSSSPTYYQSFDSKRLRLQALQESSCDGSILFPPHKFYYYESSMYTMARRYSLGKDHWGYYNGADLNKGLIPTTTFNCQGTNMTFNGNANRLPNESKMKSWSLNEIVYPTGGSSIFEYEAHKYKPGAITHVIGGLRIKKITNNDGKGGTVIKNYTYDSGILYAGLPKYDQDPKGQNMKAGIYYSGLELGIIIGSSPNPPLKSTLGYHIGYTNITETFSDNSHIVYTYKNGHATDFYLKYPSAPPTYDFGSGNLILTTHKDNLGNIKSSSENFSVTRGDLTSSLALNVVSLPCYNVNIYNQPMDYCMDPYPLSTSYNLRTSYFLLDKTTEIKDGVKTETTYTYTTDLKHSNPISITTTNSDGKVFKKELTYPSDLGSGAPAVMWDKTLTNYKHMIATVIKERTIHNSLQKHQLENNYQLLFTDKVLLTSVVEYPTGLSEFITSNYFYDSNGNLLESKNGVNPSSSFLWGYKDMFPVAKIDNASKKEFFYTSFEEETTGISTTDSRTGTKSKTGGYSKSLTGLTTGKTYILSYWQKQTTGWTYLSSEVTLASPTTSYTISLTGQVDDVKFYPKGSTMNTYTYQPQIGITSHTSPSDVTSFYEYDGFGRMINVKDANKDILKNYTYNLKKSILLSSNALSFSSSSSSSSINISTTVNWVVEKPTSSSWITVSPTSGLADKTLTVTASQNTTTASRTGYFIVKGDGLESKVNVTQAAGSPYLTVTPTTLTFNSGMSALPVTISSNISWTTLITYWSGNNWLSIQPNTSGTGNATLNVILSQTPPLGQQWTAQIRISGGGFTHYISVTANGSFY